MVGRRDDHRAGLDGHAVGQFTSFDAAPDAPNTIDLAGFRGTSTLLLFWSPSCGFCQEMLPASSAEELLQTLPSSRTRAADFTSKLLRNAAAAPMPTSQRPSRTLPDCGLRLLQPKRSAPVRKHSVS